MRKKHWLLSSLDEHQVVFLEVGPLQIFHTKWPCHLSCDWWFFYHLPTLLEKHLIGEASLKILNFSPKVLKIRKDQVCMMSIITWENSTYSTNAVDSTIVTQGKLDGRKLHKFISNNNIIRIIYLLQNLQRKKEWITLTIILGKSD